MILPPGVRYSILRNNVEVPLIPADQLPFYIQDLPRALTPFRSHQEGWKLIGETQQAALPLSIRAPPDLQSSQSSSHTSHKFLPPDYDARKDLVTMSQVPKPFRATHPAPIAPADVAVGCLISELPAGHPTSTTTEGFGVTSSEGIYCSTYRLPNPSGIEPNPSKKEYCTHWIRTNSCDFMQQGCKYKHEMPDREKLRELGFAEVPKWYRNKIAISSGASSWLRSRAAQDDKCRRLSIESSASRAFRPPTYVGRSQTRAVELPSSLAPKAGQVPVKTLNLIDLDDSSIARVSLTPSLSISSISGAVSLDAQAVVAQLSEHVTRNLASSLRQGGTDGKKPMNAPVDVDPLTTARALGRQKSDDAPLIADLGPANGTVHPLPQTLSQSRVSGLSNHQEVSEKNIISSEVTKGEHSIAEASVAPGPGGKHHNKSAKQKRNLRPRKLAERAVASATREGLSSSKYAAGKKLREGITPSKDLKRGSVQDEGKDLHFEIVQRQRAVHEKEQFRKGTSSIGFQSWVATGNIKAA